MSYARFGGCITAPQCLQVRFVEAGEEALEHRRKFRLDVLELEVLGVELVAAGLAVPEEAVLFAGAALAFHDESDRVGEALRRMRHVRWQQQDVAFADFDVDRLPVLHGLQHHVAFELVEELLARVIVKILA